jgi:hypothetical protein
MLENFEMLTYPKLKSCYMESGKIKANLDEQIKQIGKGYFV